MASLVRQNPAQALGVPSPLVDRGTVLRVEIVDPACQIFVSNPMNDANFLPTTANELGYLLPTEPNRIAGAGSYALWMAPRHWLVVADEHRDAELARRLGAAAAQTGGFVSDVTDGLVPFELAGDTVGHVLAMGCALDFESPALALGRSARTLFAGVNTILYRHGAPDRYRLHVERPFARYLADWLDKAATGLA